MKKTEKKYPTIGCCGIDCGLCPRYYTEGKSRCPGCFGQDFLKVMGQTCSFITCCVKNKNLETCGECGEFPCSKFNSKWFGTDAYDSFVTHKQTMNNLANIKRIGMEKFLDHQKKRIDFLGEMLNDFNDGRSKNFYCISTALLSIQGIKEALKNARIKIIKMNIQKKDNKSKAKILKENLVKIAQKEDVKLKLDKPPNWK